jgi:hypothetical protein
MVNFFNKHIKYLKAIIPLVAFFLYANTIPNGYNLDDELVSKNHRTTSKGFDGIPEIFSSFYYEDNSGYKYDYRPITHLSFAIENQFFGDNPLVSHFINTLLYALLCWLLFYFLSSLFPQNLQLVAWLATMLFVFHPIHTEVVASIKNRDEILALIFVLITGIMMHLGAKEKHWYLILFSLIPFLLALLSKISILSFIVLLPLAIILFENINWKQWVLICIPINLLGTYSSFLYTREKTLLLLSSIVFLFILKELKDKGAVFKDVLKLFRLSSLKVWAFLKKYLQLIINYLANHLKNFLLVFKRSTINTLMRLQGNTEKWFVDEPVIQLSFFERKWQIPLISIFLIISFFTFSSLDMLVFAQVSLIAIFVCLLLTSGNEFLFVVFLVFLSILTLRTNTFGINIQAVLSLYFSAFLLKNLSAKQRVVLAMPFFTFLLYLLILEASLKASILIMAVVILTLAFLISKVFDHKLFQRIISIVWFTFCAIYLFNTIELNEFFLDQIIPFILGIFVLLYFYVLYKIVKNPFETVNRTRVGVIVFFIIISFFQLSLSNVSQTSVQQEHKKIITETPISQFKENPPVKTTSRKIYRTYRHLWSRQRTTLFRNPREFK